MGRECIEFGHDVSGHDRLSCMKDTEIPMGKQKILDDLGERIRALISESPAHDLERNLRSLLASLFTRLDLVTREEFDVQSAVLARTREKLTRLEARLAELEQAGREQR